jgi:hypothetical protein
MLLAPLCGDTLWFVRKEQVPIIPVSRYGGKDKDLAHLEPGLPTGAGAGW